MIATADVAHWLEDGRSAGLPVYVGPLPPDVMEPHVLVTAAGGSAPLYEGLFERQTCTVRVVGPQGDYHQAEQYARIVDDAIEGWTGDIRGTRVLIVRRASWFTPVDGTDHLEQQALDGSYTLEVEAT